MFTKPAVTFAKTTFKRKTDHPQGVQKVFIALGQGHYRFNLTIQKLYLGVEVPDKINPLPPDIAFDTGAELVADLLLYGTLFGWGLYEISKATASSKAKENKYKNELFAVKNRLETLQTRNNALEREISTLLLDLETKKAEK